MPRGRAARGTTECWGASQADLELVPSRVECKLRSAAAGKAPPPFTARQAHDARRPGNVSSKIASSTSRPRSARRSPRTCGRAEPPLALHLELPHTWRGERLPHSGLSSRSRCCGSCARISGRTVGMARPPPVRSGAASAFRAHPPGVPIAAQISRWGCAS
jgi:hypothetical protein